MNAKEYLSQAMWLDKAIDFKLEQLAVLKSLSMKVTTSFTKERTSGGLPDKSKTEKIIVKVIDLENEINEDIDRLTDLKQDIKNAIKKVHDIHYQLILEMRYLGGKGWDEVAQALGYDRRWILRLHGRALKIIEEKMKEATKSH